MNSNPSFALVEDWLASIAANCELAQSIDPPVTKTKKRDRDPSMTTPPPSKSGSQSQRIGSPNKRQRFDGDDTSDNVETGWVQEEEMDEETPRSNINQRRPNLQPIAFRGYKAPGSVGIAPSLSDSLTSENSSQNQSPSEKSSVRGRRRRSPLKSANSLWVLDLPVIPVRMGDDPLQVLPDDVRNLFKSIDDIVTDHIDIFPSEIQNDVEAIMPRARKKKAWFRPAGSTHQQQQQDELGTLPRSRKPTSPLDIALHELDLLRDVAMTAQDCQVYTRSEVSWNIQVHQPLLQHALASHATVQVEPSLTARTLAPFSPMTSGRGGGSVIENKMIDFCLSLWLNDGKPRHLLDNTNTHTHAQVNTADAKLMSAIAEKVWSQPSDAQSINQTGYPPLQFAPIACNIETKISSIQQDGELQLSVWTAAWFQRMAMLVPERIAQHGIVTLPLLYIVGHDWKLSFASWREDRIEIIGSLVLGDTRTLLGSYTIVAVLRKIGDWIATVYRAWIEKMFL
ncbi:hypothetical protein FOMG_18867 [Fusarium oxysporum f. sp. melonis 26406]|uniref:PD-(D/E)XK nuclease-like domain-containing protein n=2 Tax=Fusarium oxysporum TaxID=5507 RepID=A0A2H3FUS2_FUSOX|nr:hypothetical protein FOMG_18867 [Fusarium oxysporum f. sp. melonis 26406]PCD22196.1 hypothetical protein AU210_015989 [Fusarium oxysporum f. sp. radicis-cucumerinum]